MRDSLRMQKHRATKVPDAKRHTPNPSPPPDYEHRQRIETDLDTTMLVEAAAGTGKTTAMVNRMVALICEDRCTLDSMAAVTFTRKASSELAERFRSALERTATETKGPAGRRFRRNTGLLVLRE